MTIVRRGPLHDLSDLRRSGSLQKGALGLGKENVREENLAVGQCNTPLIRRRRLYREWQLSPRHPYLKDPVQRNPLHPQGVHHQPAKWMQLAAVELVTAEGWEPMVA